VFLLTVQMSNIYAYKKLVVAVTWEVECPCAMQCSV